MPPKLIAALLAGVSCLPHAPVLAREVGIVGAVNPASQGTPPGGAARTLQLGQQVIFREKVTTTAAGSVQLAFIDKSTLTIGANSTVVIDEYVFNPATDTGKMTVSVAKGVMRFVGGQISHGGNALIKTPTATIGLRGAAGSVTVGSDGTTTYNHHFGRASVQTITGGTQIVSRPGFSVTVASASAAPSSPVRTPQSNIDQVTTATLSGPAQSGGAASRPNDTQAASRLGNTQIATVPSQSVPVQSGTASRSTTTTSETVAVTNSSETAQVLQNATTAAAIEPVVARVATPRAFTLTTPSVNGALPYLSAVFVGPNGPSTVMTPILAYRVGGSGDNSERSSAIQVSLAINGQGRNQTSQMVVAAGTLYQRRAGGATEFSGGFDASGRNAANQNIGRSSGALTSVAGGVQLDQDQLPSSIRFDQNQINRATGERYEATARATVPTEIEPRRYTYDVTATQTASAAGLGQNRPALTLSGFAGGILQYSRFSDDTSTSEQLARGYSLIRSATNSPGDVLIELDPATSRASANIKVIQTGSFTTLRAADFQFGGAAAGDRARSGYIDTNNFALRGRVSDVDTATDETRTTSTYLATYGSGTYGGSTPTGSAAGRLGLLAWDTIAQQDPTAASRFFPGTSLCACEYTKWGFWSADLSRYIGNGSQIDNDRGNLLLWVAGQQANAASIPSVGTATYNGHAIANVYDTSSGTRYQYVAAGNFSNTVNFANRTSAVTINNLDGLTYRGTTVINPTNGTFIGNLASNATPAYGTVSGPLVGAFYGSGTTVPQEVGGQFNALSSRVVNGGNVYFMGGVFLGKR